MKKFVSLLLVILMTLSLSGCNRKKYQIEYEQKYKEKLEEIFSREEIEEKDEEEEEIYMPLPTKQSDDKHIAYIANYIGKNCASIGYTSIGGDRNDYIGQAYIHLIFETADGQYLDIEDDEVLKQYVVVAQNIEPNAEVRLGFSLDSEGNEYDYLVNFQSYEEIVLRVKKIGEDTKFSNKLTEINPAEDRYTYYIPDFVGRNLLYCGYISLGGDLRFSIGCANIKINIVTDDGSYVEISDEALRNYVVYAQNIVPNSEFKLQYETDSTGEEYDNLVRQQSYKEIDLYVEKIN